MRYPGLILAELEHRSGNDTNRVVPTMGVILYEKKPKLNRTLADDLAHGLVDLTLARKVLKDVVVGLILFHTVIIFHGDIKPQSIVQCVSSWKLTDLNTSQKIGDATHNVEKYNWGYIMSCITYFL